MRTKVTLVLVFLNVTLFFFIFYVYPRIVEIRDLGEARRRVLPAADTDVRAIEIQTRDRVVQITKRNGRWYLEKPVQWPANPAAVSGMLTELQLLEDETAFDVSSLAQNKLSLADYGLDKPAIVVTLTPAQPVGSQRKAPAPVVLKIGNVTNVGNRLYVLSPDGKRIHVVARSLADILSLPVSEIRSPTVFEIPSFEARSFGVQFPPPASRVRIQRDASRWYFVSPFVGRANSDDVKLTLTRLLGLHVGPFITDPVPSDLSPSDNPAMRVTVEGNNRSQTLLIGGPIAATPGHPIPPGIQEFYAQMDDRPTRFVLQIPSDLFEKIRTAQDSLRERHLLEFDPAQLSSITLRAPNQPDLTLQHLEGTTGGDSGWQIVQRIGDAAPTTQPADPVAVQELIERLTQLSATKFLNDAPSAAAEEAWGFNSPERTVVLQLANAPQPVPGSPTGPSIELQIGVGTERGPHAYARLASAQYVYEVDSEILRETPVDARDWRNRKLRELPIGARIVGVRIVRLSDDKVIRRIDLPAGAAAPAEAAAPANSSKVVRDAWQTLLVDLRTLRAKTFVYDHFHDTVALAGVVQPWKYRLDMDIALTAGAGVQTSTQSLLLTDRLGGTQQIAGSKDLDAVFEIDQSMIDALWTLTFNAEVQTPTPPAAPAPAPAAPASAH